jgi:CRISPR/Cas system CMR-associated protein Cmr3 (group 5 of RAMP superfamily)
MAITQHESGTKDFAGDVNDTWDVLNTTTPETTDGAFQIFVDANAIIAGDTLEGDLQEKCISGGTARKVWQFSITGAQALPMIVSPTVLLLHGWDFRMRQRAGTGRSIPWSVRKVT